MPLAGVSAPCAGGVLLARPASRFRATEGLRGSTRDEIMSRFRRLRSTWDGTLDRGRAEPELRPVEASRRVRLQTLVIISRRTGVKTLIK